MPPQPRAALLLVPVAALAGLLVYFRYNPKPQHHSGDLTPAHQSASPTIPPPEPTAEALPSKTKPRLPSPLVTKARTKVILETRIPGPVEFPEQTLAERVTAINQWLEQAGVPRDLLRVAVEARTAARSGNLKCVLESFAVEDETPKTVLRYTTGPTRFYFVVHAGLAEITAVIFAPHRPDQPAAEPAATD